jgi:hypothetical protein
MHIDLELLYPVSYHNDLSKLTDIPAHSASISAADILARDLSSMLSPSEQCVFLSEHISLNEKGQ